MEDNINNTPDNKRWYDKDPILKEALELLRLSSPDEQEHAKDFYSAAAGTGCRRSDRAYLSDYHTV